MSFSRRRRRALVVIGWVPRPGDVGDLGWHAEAFEDGVGGLGIVDGGDHSHPAVALRTLLQIDGEVVGVGGG